MVTWAGETASVLTLVSTQEQAFADNPLLMQDIPPIPLLVPTDSLDSGAAEREVALKRRVTELEHRIRTLEGQLQVI